jgi:hypothetical protein
MTLEITLADITERLRQGRFANEQAISATIEQRTGRIDRIGSKVERERAGAPVGAQPSLDVAVPYLAATYDERMFEELHKRAEFFEVTMGGDLRVDGRFSDEERLRNARSRVKLGIGTDEEDVG